MWDYEELFICICSGNTELIDLRIIICLRKFEVSVERISVCNVIEKLMEHGIHCLPCFYTRDIISLFRKQLGPHIDFKVTSLGCHFVKVLSTTVGYSLVAMVTDLCHHLTFD